MSLAACHSRFSELTMYECGEITDEGVFSFLRRQTRIRVLELAAFGSLTGGPLTKFHHVAVRHVASMSPRAKRYFRGRRPSQKWSEGKGEGDGLPRSPLPGSGIFFYSCSGYRSCLNVCDGVFCKNARLPNWHQELRTNLIGETSHAPQQRKIGDSNAENVLWDPPNRCRSSNDIYFA